MATPHINAEMGDFADVVLMPGDPLRAKHIAETFLEDVREVNNVRGAAELLFPSASLLHRMPYVHPRSRSVSSFEFPG